MKNLILFSLLLMSASASAVSEAYSENYYSKEITESLVEIDQIAKQFTNAKISNHGNLMPEDWDWDFNNLKNALKRSIQNLEVEVKELYGKAPYREFAIIFGCLHSIKELTSDIYTYQSHSASADDGGLSLLVNAIDRMLYDDGTPQTKKTLEAGSRIQDLIKVTLDGLKK